MSYEAKTNWVAEDSLTEMDLNRIEAGIKSIDSLVKKIEDGISAAELLKKIKGIDGIGSGLDADLLRGKSPSDFIEKTGGEMTGNLKLPSISIADRYRIKVLNIEMLNPSGQNEFEIDLGTASFAGTLLVTVASIWNSGNASGSIKKAIDISVSESINSQISRYLYTGENTKTHFMISDIYLKKGRKTIKITQSAASRNAAYVILEGLGGFDGLENATAGQVVVSTELFIQPSMSPDKTVISSGFATGWNGQITYRKNQENKCTVFLYLTKSTDIADKEIIYTLPLGFRPDITHTATCFLMRSDGMPLAFGVVSVDSQGALKVQVLNGQTLTNTRIIYCIALDYYIS